MKIERVVNLQLINLQFINRTAEETLEMVISSAALTRIVAWYNSYYHGDDYDVFVNSKKAQLDQDGELAPKIAESIIREID